MLIEMEMAPADEEPDPPLLTDSGTESFNDSPTADDSSTSATSTGHWELNSQQQIHISVKNILDKSISIDEEILIHPLVPEVISLHSLSMGAPNGKQHPPPLISILRRTSFYDTLGMDELMQNRHLRRVSFPENAHVLATYRESDLQSPTLPDQPWDAEQLLQEYQASCTRHKTIQLDAIKNQLATFKNNINSSETLSLATITVTMEVCETLEDIFKVANFHKLIIKDCTFTNHSVREFIDLLDYYNCTTEIVTTDYYTQENEIWAAFSSMLSKCNHLEALTFETFTFSDSHFRTLLNNLRNHHDIRVLKFQGCMLGHHAITQLVNALETNMVLQELYLPQTGLYTKETEVLSRLLTKNHNIRVLDISNNPIGDRGLEALARGLCTHTDANNGLSVLVIYNTQISEKSGQALSNIISGCKSLHTLNVGCNNLTDEVISKLIESLAVTATVEGLGLQTTLLTDRGASQLADAVRNNRSLQKINIKGNKGIQSQGLESLCKALTNSKIIKVEIDETNRNCDNPEEYSAMVAQINAICTVNKSRLETTNGDEEEMNNLSMYFLRKISLNCEPTYHLPAVELPEHKAKSSRKKSPALSPMQSPGCSPTPHSRFSVSRVPDPLTRSRFTVMPVKLPRDFGSGDTLANSPPPDDDLCVHNQFSNIRSSVSSIESVDSISTKDSVYDSTTPSGESD